MLEVNKGLFYQEGLMSIIANASTTELDEIDFGVIGFDDAGLVQRYNLLESKLAGLRPQNVIGSHIFTNVAPCMNNFMVAQRFEDARESSTSLDTIIDYVLTLRMRPIKVKLRLLSRPDVLIRFILVLRAT